MLRTQELSCSDSSKLLPYLCRILQKYTVFGGSNTYPSIFLKSSSNIAQECGLVVNDVGSESWRQVQIPAEAKHLQFLPIYPSFGAQNYYGISRGVQAGLGTTILKKKLKKLHCQFWQYLHALLYSMLKKHAFTLVSL